MNSTMVREYLRRHVLGLVAIFIALSGTAIAAGDNPTASTSVVTNAKFKKLKQRVTALETKLNTPVSGDIEGTFPNLTIKSNAVTSGKIADNAVTAAKIAANAVSTTKIADNAVTTAKIAADAVTAAKIGADQVGSSEIATGAVGQTEVASNAIGAAELKDLVEADGTVDSVAAGTSALEGNGGCPSSGQIISGGGIWNSTDPDLATMDSFAFLGAWLTHVSNQDGAAHNYTPIGFCLPA